MKKLVYGVSLFAALMFGACNQQPINTNEKQNKELNFTKVVVALHDKQTHDMESNLFYGADSTNKALVDSLFPEGAIPAAMGCFYVDFGSPVLFDAGLNAGEGGIDSALTAAGLSYDAIHTIFITHCHADHIGGLVAANGTAAFPNADIWVPKAEYDYWVDKYDLVPNTFKVYAPEKIHFFTYNDKLPLGVQAIAAPGHTPGHTAYRFGNVLMAGDFMHGMELQKNHPDISCKYDEDPVMAAQARKDLLQLAAKEKLTIYGHHLPGSGLFK